MTVKVGINGFGRIGRLALRESWGAAGFEVVHINEIAGDAKSAAHLLKFDSVHGTWDADISANSDQITVDDKIIGYSQCATIETTPWAEAKVDLIVECTGTLKTEALLDPFFAQGVRKVLVSAPIKGLPEERVLNVVMGVNDHRYQGQNIVTAASCTTNCLAPVIDVLHQTFGIEHGAITTIHDITNTQSILDEYHSDLRRARASSMSLIPTSTGSATAITEIFPELKGRLNGLAVRVPLANASLTDCVFELKKSVTADQVNEALETAANGRLKGILGFETLPLVSVDYTNDRRSGIVDGPSTMVINQSQVKVLIWYDNEIGYVNRMMELAEKIAASL
ncbi:MAG: ArsJ-associated glyceraldehyde-3-phosphate dehydrogenase [Porticoccaceae bacterium]|jgi:glyceraldehyde 3-phosphate dehydrogenase|nr:ArsJ-associated glyceraldehyde-3-phosphate dehydrogenase [Porticoccaceae bacterium]MBT5577447.1 ArsJ-associated glyceraldehyde-3-phosphate dehydrogenase [Porticoccaceae bacterium]MBT7375103.1 ArsJ-associated glyceraldehyde-3-phosphate dehydrogenase [Porticoccaceae bacterium]